MNYQTMHSYWLPKEPKARISLSSFRKKVSIYTKEFADICRKINNIYDNFNAQMEVLPDDCDNAVEIMQNLQSNLSQLNLFLETSDYLPENIVPIRYNMVFSLHLLDDLVYQILPLLYTYRRECLEINTRTLRMQRQLVEHFERIMEVSNQVEPQAKLLLGK